jgi:hypothetical protein
LQLTGIMGGLGLRHRAVRGWPNKRNGGGRSTRALWDHERRDRQDFYKMTDHLRSVIRAANIAEPSPPCGLSSALPWGANLMTIDK